MSSILTNDGAMVALQTLQSINGSLIETQNQIATGKRVADATDNAAVWAISKTMEADVLGFSKISESLSLGQATVSVARQASETVTDLLTEIKGHVVAAQGENVDRSKIQSDISALRDQIGAVVETAQFNGLALLQNTGTESGSGETRILSSLDRSMSGITASDITVRKRDLSTTAASISATGGTYSSAVDSATLNGTQTGSLDVSGQTVETGMAFSISIFATDGDGSSFDPSALSTTAAAAGNQAEMAAAEMSYVAREGDTISDVTNALGKKWDAWSRGNDIGADTLSMSFSGGSIDLSSTATTASDTIVVSFNTLTADAGNTIGGGLDMLSDLDVSTDEGAAMALGQIDSLIETAIETSASFGSDQRRLDTQSDFIGGLTDALRSGIGTLVDADLEESSARLQALQVQQQLGIQALSIANSAPSVMLSLFR